MAEQKEQRIIFDSPLREGNDYYLSTLMKSMMYVNVVLSDTTFNFNDPRIPLLIESLIQMVVNKKNRAEIYKSIAENKTNILNELTEQERKNLSATDKNRINIMAHLRSMGMVTDFVGIHKGITSENRISVVVTKPNISIQDVSDLKDDVTKPDNTTEPDDTDTDADSE